MPDENQWHKIGIIHSLAELLGTDRDLKISVSFLSFFLLSMKIINKQSIIGIKKEVYLSQTEDYSPEASFPDYSEKLLQRSMVFSIVLCVVRTNNIKQVKDIFLQGFKKTDQHIPSESVWPWHLGRESYH